MKKKFRITEDQARKIMMLKESDPCTSWLASQASTPGTNYSCCDLYNANPNASFPAFCDASWTPSGGPGSDGWKECCIDDTTSTGDDPCKNPQYNGEDCFVCRKPGPLGCQSLGALGLTVATAAPNTVYNDVNICNATEKCRPDDRGEPCTVTVTPNDNDWGQCMECYAGTSAAGPNNAHNPTMAAITGWNCECCEKDGRTNTSTGEGCPDEECKNPNHVQVMVSPGPPVKCECQCREGAGEKGCITQPYGNWNKEECCCADKKGNCDPNSIVGPPLQTENRRLAPAETKDQKELREEMTRIKELLK